jgi:hypothetical protein
MRSQLFESISINRQKIDWKTCSGIAMGVQKYTKTHVRGGGDSSVSYSIETITELSILQANSNETQVILRGEEIRVRDGQRVSVIWGCTAARKRELIFINHDDSDKLYWVDKPRSFFNYLGIFICFSKDSIYIWLMLGLLLCFMTSRIFSIFLMVAIIGIYLGAGIVFLIIQEYRVRSAWSIIKPQILEIVRQLNINTNLIY